MTQQFHVRHYMIDTPLVIGGVTLCIALLHLYVACRGIQRERNLPFAAASVLVASEAFTSPGRRLHSWIPAFNCP